MAEHRIVTTKKSKKTTRNKEQTSDSRDILLELNAKLPKEAQQLEEHMARIRAKMELIKFKQDLATHASDLEAAETKRLTAIAERYQLSVLEETCDLAMRTERMSVAALEIESARMLAQAEHSLVYSFYGRVGAEEVAAAVQTLDMWSRTYPGKTIEVQLTSPGGSVGDGLALHDFLRALSARGHNVVVSVYGFAASMGAVILQAGDERVIGANSFIMIHEVSGGVGGSVASMADNLVIYNMIQDSIIKILCNKTKLTAKEVRSMWHKKDVWLDSVKALKIGLVDSIAR